MARNVPFVGKHNGLSQKIIFRQPRFTANFLQLPKKICGVVGVLILETLRRLGWPSVCMCRLLRCTFSLYAQVETEDLYETQSTKMVQIHYPPLGTRKTYPTKRVFSAGKSSIQKWFLGRGYGTVPNRGIVWFASSHMMSCGKSRGKGWIVAHILSGILRYHLAVSLRSIAGVQESKYGVIN